MKITTITKEVMDNLKPGDVCGTVISDRVTVDERMPSSDSLYPHLLKFKELPGGHTFTDEGKFDIEMTALDIISVEKAVEIPEGFTRWDGGECPPVEGKVEYTMRERPYANSVIVQSSHTESVSVIFNPFVTKGKWKYGDGLELLEEK